MAVQKKSALCCGKSNNHTMKRLFGEIRGYGPVVTIQVLLQEGVDIDARDSKGRTPLLLACWRHRKKIADLLIKTGANVDTKCTANEYTVLLQASRYGWTKIVRTLVKKVPDLDARDIRGETAIHHASRSGHLKIVKCLLKEGADISRKNLVGFTPLICAAQYSKKGVFDLLLDSGAQVGDNKRLLLYYACRNSWKETVQSLLKRAPELNRRYVIGEKDLDVTSSEGHLEVLKFLVEEGTDISEEYDMIRQEALYHASYMGHLEVLKWLVKKEVIKRVPNLNARHTSGYTALYIASLMGHLEIVKYLVQEGADINVRDYMGGLPLHIAIVKEHLEVVKWLVKKGTDVKSVPYLNARVRNGDTALQFASGSGHLEIIKFLVESGAEINTRDNDGATPLHTASVNGHLEVVKWLVEKGADINAKTCLDETPLLYAALGSYKDVVDLLINLGANLDNDQEMCTMLHLASGEGWIELVMSLINRGCNLDTQDESGMTALSNACCCHQLDTARAILQAGASWDTVDEIGDSPLNYLTKEEKPDFEFIKLLIENGAYLKPIDYNAIVKSSSLEVLQDARLCCQAILNKFNNHDLAEFSKLFAARSLPCIEKMKIGNCSEVAQAIARTVDFEIQTKGHCNIMEVRPMALSVFSVKSVLDYKKIHQLEKSVKKRPAAFDLLNNYQHSSKSMRLS